MWAEVGLSGKVRVTHQACGWQMMRTPRVNIDHSVYSVKVWFVGRSMDVGGNRGSSPWFLCDDLFMSARPGSQQKDLQRSQPQLCVTF